MNKELATPEGRPTNVVAQRSKVRRPAKLALAGQLLFIGVTQFHVGGDANAHHEIFGHYAADGGWYAIHLAQFAAMGMLLFAIVGLFGSLGRQSRAQVTARVGAVATGAALALYGVLQAVDGVALKHAVDSWVTASDAQEAKFAAAEAVRWLEWGSRSMHDVVFGAALVLLAVAVARGSDVPRALPVVIGASGLAYVVQAWIVGTEGFTPAHSAAIIAGWVLSLVWMIWLHASGRVADRSSAPAAVAVAA